MTIILPGQYPRSEALIAASRQFDRKQISLESLRNVQHQDLHDFDKLQEGFQYRSTGLFAWQDLLRPYVEIVENSQCKKLVRFYETNSFWRELSYSDQLAIVESKVDDWIAKWFFADGFYDVKAPLVFTLPYIYLFQKYAPGFSLENSSSLLELIAKKLINFPNKILCFFEPTIGWKPLSDQERQTGIALIKTLKKSSNSPIYLSTAFFPVTKESKFLSKLPVNGIGIDFFANSVEDISSWFPKDKTILAGILNTDSTCIETREQFDRFSTMAKQSGLNNIIYTHAGIAEQLPRAIMDKKVQALKEWMS